MGPLLTAGLTDAHRSHFCTSCCCNDNCQAYAVMAAAVKQRATSVLKMLLIHINCHMHCFDARPLLTRKLGNTQLMLSSIRQMKMSSTQDQIGNLVDILSRNAQQGGCCGTSATLLLHTHKTFSHTKQCTAQRQVCGKIRAGLQQTRPLCI